MNRTLHTFVACAAVLGAAGAAAYAPAATAAAPGKMALPLNGKNFFTAGMAFSSKGDRICLIGTDFDAMGNGKPRVLLVDRERKTTLWDKQLPLPDGIVSLNLAECAVEDDRVYLLANGFTRHTPDLTSIHAYLYAFAPGGEQIATTRLDVRSDDQFAHTMRATPEGLTVSGFVKDVGDKDEHYAMFTASFDTHLHAQGTASLRKNGAYTTPYAARFIDDSLYVTGTFFPASIPKDSPGKLMASRLKTNGAYVWSSAVPQTGDNTRRFAIGPDGTSYTFGVGQDSTSLSLIAPNGQVRTPLTQQGGYCSVNALAHYGHGLAAVVTPCTGKTHQLVAIDPTSGALTGVKTIPGDPLYVSANASSWSVLASDANGKTYLYTGSAGDL